MSDKELIQCLSGEEVSHEMLHTFGSTSLTQEELTTGVITIVETK